MYVNLIYRLDRWVRIAINENKIADSVKGHED